MPTAFDLSAVSEAIQETEAITIAPRFRRLTADEVHEKTLGEIVTDADRACETLLTKRLKNIADIPVIGEEAAASDPNMLRSIQSTSTCWIVDPLDGTSNFVAGSGDYAVMVAYLDRGNLAASWIWQPSTADMYVTERGCGAEVNGERLVPAAPNAQGDPISGIVKDRFLPPAIRSNLAERRSSLGNVIIEDQCAGFTYPLLAKGEIDYALYWRTLPWDHAPGVLLASETGCSALRPDGAAYTAHTSDEGLVVARRSVANMLLDALLGRSPIDN